jgi:hypothetical protein
MPHPLLGNVLGNDLQISFAWDSHDKFRTINNVRSDPGRDPEPPRLATETREASDDPGNQYHTSQAMDPLHATVRSIV